MFRSTRIDSTLLLLLVMSIAALMTACGSSGNSPVLIATATPTPTATATPTPTATPSPSFVGTGSMTTGRWNHTATLLSSGPETGQVLVAGGIGASATVLASAELYDPTAGLFTATGSMTTVRSSHTATLFASGPLAGQVLITGGNGVIAGLEAILFSAELYNPATGTFTATGTMADARLLHTATLLTSGPLAGKVLVAGGLSYGVGPGGAAGSTASAELYDPSTGSFTSTASMTVARQSHTATLLTSGPLAGQVLIVGGNTNGPGGDSNVAVASAELYNPVTGLFTATGAMSTPRSGHTATLLSSGPLSGQVLVAGGTAGTVGLTSAELYNPATGAFTVTGSMSTPRFNQAATFISAGPLQGQVLISGGASGGASLATAELYDQSIGVFTTTATMSTPRESHTATFLTGGPLAGDVLIAGGVEAGTISGESSAELYQQ